MWVELIYTHTYPHTRTLHILLPQVVALKPASLPAGTTHTVLLPPLSLGPRAKAKVGVAASSTWCDASGSDCCWFLSLQPFLLVEQCDGMEYALPLTAWGMD